jgi:TolB-like protein
MKKYLSLPCACAVLLALSCASQPASVTAEAASASVTAEAASVTGTAGAVPDTGNRVSLDQAIAEIAAYYAAALPANAKIALTGFDAEARLLSDYIFEELWIHFENRASFVMVDRQNLERIQKELNYQYSGEVSDESARALGRQLGAQTLVYGKITPLGGEYRLVVRATDVEKAVTSIRAAAVVPDRRFAALLETPYGGQSGMDGAGMAQVLYSGDANPWQFTVRTDRPGGAYRDGEYMTLRVYSDHDAWFKITHIDVHGNAQVIYPLAPGDRNFIRAGETRQIPDHSRFKMTAPYGEETILAAAYESPFAVREGAAAPLSSRLLSRGIVVEREDTRQEMRPLAAARFTYRIGP